MAKITLPDTDSGYNIATINDNFQKIEDELNNKVLYRDNLAGEPNAMDSNLDMNSNRIYNLPAPVNNSEAARLQDVQNAIAGANAANLVSFSPTGNISSTNVQGAIQELDTEKFSADGGTLNGNLVITGDVSVSGVARRFRGDFSNNTVVSRVYFQDATTNNTSLVGVLPNGTGSNSGFAGFNNSDPSNCSLISIQAFTLDARISSGKTGAGTFLPLTLYTNGLERMRINTSGTVDFTATADSLITSLGGAGYGGFAARGSGVNPGYIFFSNVTNGEQARITGQDGNILAFATGNSAIERFRIDGSTGFVGALNCNGIGYATGSGGSVTQIGPKTTSVTLNKASGLISLNNGSIGANTTVLFTVNNSQVAVTDLVVIHRLGGGGTAGAYQIWVDSIGIGSFVVAIRNTTGGALAESFNLIFNIFKATFL